MKTTERFINHYENGYMPWAHNKPDFNLVEMVRSRPVNPCKTLELGCGTGTDSVWLSQHGFEVTGIDVSPVAIEMAVKKATEFKVNCRFRVFDFLKESMNNTKFDFVFDRGYFHSYKTRSLRKKVAKKIAEHMNPDGLWLSLIGSCDSPPRDSGPPMRSAKDIINAVEPFFELQVLQKSKFGSENENPTNNWVCLMKKRE